MSADAAALCRRWLPISVATGTPKRTLLPRRQSDQGPGPLRFNGGDAIDQLLGLSASIGGGLTCAALPASCPVAGPIALGGLGLSVGANALTAGLNCPADVEGGITCGASIAGAALSFAGIKGAFSLNAALRSGVIDQATFRAATYHLAYPTLFLDAGAYALARYAAPAGDSRPSPGAIVSRVGVDFKTGDGGEVGRLEVWRRRELT